MMTFLQTVHLVRPPPLRRHAPARCFVTATGEPYAGPPSPVPAMVERNLAHARMLLDLARLREAAKVDAEWGRLAKGAA